MKKILVPCDFSMPAQEAFKFAVKIAAQNKGEIHVLYVLDITFLGGKPTLSHTFAFNLNFLKELEQEAEVKFTDMRNQFAPSDLRVHFKHMVGSLIPDIERYVREHSIDMVMTGTHGEGYRSWATNTEEIVRYSPVPVLSVRQYPEKAIRNIVVPVVPDQLNAAFCNHLKELRTLFDATLHLLWVNTPHLFKSDGVSRAELEVFARTHQLKHYAIHVRADYRVELGIQRFAQQIDADMIAMATHARKGLVHVITGSIAENVVKHFDIPIWTCSLNTQHALVDEMMTVAAMR